MIRVLGISAVALSALTLLGCMPYRPMEYDSTYYPGKGRDVQTARQPERFAEKRDVPSPIETVGNPKMGGGKPVGNPGNDVARIPATPVPKAGDNRPIDKPTPGPLKGPTIVVDPGVRVDPSVKSVKKEETPRELPLTKPSETTEVTKPDTVKTPIDPVIKTPVDPVVKTPETSNKVPTTNTPDTEIVKPDWPTLKPPIGAERLPITPERPAPKPVPESGMGGFPVLPRPENPSDLKFPINNNDPSIEKGGPREIQLIPTAPGATLPPALPPVQPPVLPGHQSNFGSPSQKPSTVMSDPSLTKAVSAFKADKKDELAEALKKYDAKTQEALLKLLPTLAKIYEGNLSGMSPSEVSSVLDQLKNLSLAMTPKAVLDANNVALCREVYNFGHIEAFPETHTFRGGDTVYLYMEMVNFSTPALQGGPGFAVDLDGLLAIQDGAGRVVWDANPRDEVDRLTTPPQDYYRSYRFCLPATLSPGKYSISVKMIDRPTGREVTKVIPFRVGTR